MFSRYRNGGVLLRFVADNRLIEGLANTAASMTRLQTGQRSAIGHILAVSSVHIVGLNAVLKIKLRCASRLVSIKIILFLGAVRALSFRQRVLHALLMAFAG